MIKWFFATFFLAALLFFNLYDRSNLEKSFDNVLIIGWDGCRYKTIETLLKKNRIPNVLRLSRSGMITPSFVSQGATQTKPGWAQVFTGYNSTVTGVISNTDYRPIPKGYTVFEKIKSHQGANLKTLFISGKANNVGARGPHRICMNCIRRTKDRQKTYWWDDQRKNIPTTDGRPMRYETREGEPFFFSQNSLDVYRVSLENSDNVAQFATAELKKIVIEKRNFLAFFHFEEPDELGHQFGEGSEQYLAAVEKNDALIGQWLQILEENHLLQKTAVIVTSDHGFDPGKMGHSRAPDTFLITNFKLNSFPIYDRRDIAPTLLDIFKINHNNQEPRLDGKSLLR